MGLGAFQHFHYPTAILFVLFSIISGRGNAFKEQEIIATQRINRKDTSAIMPVVSFLSSNPGHPNERPKNRMLIIEHNNLIHTKLGLNFFFFFEQKVLASLNLVKKLIWAPKP